MPQAEIASFRAGLLGVILASCAAAQSYAPAVAQGRTLSAAAAEQIESSLTTNPGDLTARAQLLGYYSSHSAQDTGMRAARLRQIEWLVKNQAACPLLHNAAAKLQASDFAPPNGNYLDALRRDWQEQVDQHPDDVLVLENAVESLAALDLNSDGNAEKLAGYLKRLRVLEPGDPEWVVYLASVYDQALMRGIAPLASPETKLFVAAITAELEKSEDSALVGRTGQILRVAIQAISPTQGLMQTALGQLRVLSESLLRRAATLNPKNPNWAKALVSAPPRNLAELQASVAGTLEESDLWPGGLAPQMKVPAGTVRVAAEAVVPEAPLTAASPPASAIGTDCSVRFNALLGSDGRMVAVEAAGFSHLNVPFLAAERDALREGRYRPVQINGRPVEAVTQIEKKCAADGPKQIAMLREDELPAHSQTPTPGAAGNAPSGAPGRLTGSLPSSAAAPGPAGSPTQATPRVFSPPRVGLPAASFDPSQYGDPLGKVAPSINCPTSGAGAALPPSVRASGVFRVGGGVSAPVLLHRVEPGYSEEARKAGCEGTVVLYTEVDTTGHAVHIQVVRALGLGLDEKAIEAVRQWQFKPGYKDGQPVPVAATIEVSFRLITSWRITRLEYAAAAAAVKPVLIGRTFPPSCESGGAASVSFEVSAEGRPEKGRIIHSENSTLAEAVLKSIESWKFRPATQGGAAVAASAEADLACTNPSAIQHVQIAANVMQAQLSRQKPPVYPPLAKQARIQGAVRLKVIVGRDGSVQSATLIEGHPLLLN